MDQKFDVFHILVKHEYEAQDILKKLNEGWSFELAARQFSNCASATQGGALGPYKPGRFVEAFDEGLQNLKLHEVSQPVRTRFGYHLILKKKSV